MKKWIRDIAIDLAARDLVIRHDLKFELVRGKLVKISNGMKRRKR